MSRVAVITAGFAVLFLLHQDSWWRDDPTLVFGILPVSLAYHIVWTLVVAGGWLLVVRRAWPDGLDGPSRWEPAAGVADPGPTAPAPSATDVHAGASDAGQPRPRSAPR